MRLLAVIIIGVLLLDLFYSSEAWWWSRRRRRRRSCHTPSLKKGKWYSRWDQSFTFKCPSGQVVTEVHSLYSSCYKDRVFKFACRKNIAAKGLCHWSHYVNGFDEVLAFKCPYRGFISGISGKHVSHYDDRIFKFRCCAHSLFHRYHCTTSINYVNEWGKTFNFTTPQKHFLVGATSYHDNSQKDRRWKFESCKVARSTHGWSRHRKPKKG